MTKLYAEFKWAQDPINRIIDNMTIKRPKRRVVEKIMGRFLLFPVLTLITLTTIIITTLTSS